MLAVLDLHPMLRRACLIRTVAALRHQSLQSHPARRREEIRTDLATLERIDENTLRPARKQPFKIGLAHRQRELAQIITAFDENSKAQS